ncbi:MAG: hypothetical protein ACYCYM_04990 [Saccharofermentanales bacterium]
MTCWFCSAVEEKSEKSYKIKMFGEVDAKANASVTKVRYSVHSIEVPRCAMCRSKHNSAVFFTIISSVLGFMALVLLLSAAFDVLTGFMPGLLTGLIAGVSLGGYAVRLALHKGILSVAKARKIYPEVKELLDRGFRFGKAPRGGMLITQEEDEPAVDRPEDK